MNFRTIIALIIIAFTSLSCDIDGALYQKSPNTISEDFAILQKKYEEIFRVRILKTSNGKDIVFKISNPIGMSLEDVIIIGANFENKIPIILTEIDPINKIELYDIDNDGFEELFIFTTATGSGSYGNIYAFSSNKYLGLTSIKVDSFLIENYIGHDTFNFNKDKLIRTYLVENNDIKQKSSISYSYNGSFLNIDQ